eukprot:53869-Pyramimonas_sp.AAC.1
MFTNRPMLLYVVLAATSGILFGLRYATTVVPPPPPGKGAGSGVPMHNNYLQSYEGYVGVGLGSGRGHGRDQKGRGGTVRGKGNGRAWVDGEQRN